MQWRKIASLWRFKLDTKSGPLETGDFGEIGDFSENLQRVGNNGDKRPGPLETDESGENRQRAGDNGDKRPGLLETGDFGENGDCGEIDDFGENRQRAGDIYPACGKYSNWMPKVAPSN